MIFLAQVNSWLCRRAKRLAQQGAEAVQTNQIYKRVTQQIIDAIEAGAGAASYRMPWHNWWHSASCPTNVTTGRAYRGINILLLWAAAEVQGYSSGRWAAYRQWTTAGAQVRKGAKATPNHLLEDLNRRTIMR